MEGAVWERMDWDWGHFGNGIGGRGDVRRLLEAFREGRRDLMRTESEDEAALLMALFVLLLLFKVEEKPSTKP